MPTKSETNYWLRAGQYEVEKNGAPRISGLVWFPIKSGRPEFADRLYVSREGFKPKPESKSSDRQIMVTDENGKMLSQRQLARLALLEVQVYDEVVYCHFRADQANPELQAKMGYTDPLSFSFDLQTSPSLDNPQISTKIHTTEGVQAIDQGETVATIFSDILEKKVRVVYQKPDEPRRRKETAPALPDIETILRCADSYPFTALSYTTLDILNQKLQQEYEGKPLFEPISFRMNLLISGEINEHTLVGKYIKIGSVYFYVQRPKLRCPMPAIDQETAERRGGFEYGSEYQGVLKELHEELEIPEAWRENDEGKTAMMGVDMIPLNQGYINVNDRIEVLDELPPEIIEQLRQNAA
jgi:uncharacterized protein YcbX